MSREDPNKVLDRQKSEGIKGKGSVGYRGFSLSIAKPPPPPF